MTGKITLVRPLDAVLTGDDATGIGRIDTDIGDHRLQDGVGDRVDAVDGPGRVADERELTAGDAHRRADNRDDLVFTLREVLVDSDEVTDRKAGP
ncbi:hypothetical protein D9M68_361940 [compost metagenome]